MELPGLHGDEAEAQQEREGGVAGAVLEVVAIGAGHGGSFWGGPWVDRGAGAPVRKRSHVGGGNRADAAGAEVGGETGAETPTCGKAAGFTSIRFESDAPEPAVNSVVFAHNRRGGEKL